MFRFRTLSVVAALAAVSVASFAQDDQHKAHHPAGAASAAMPAPATGKPAGMPDMAMMDKHMKAMQAMHDKMASAKTPAEREVLMAEHMKLMQEGMSMMGGMAPGKAPANAVARQQMMEKRMDMMQSMMQMMMDRMPMSPAAPGK
ncbi:MAG: hypothetical protein IPK29_11625 [Betaproteobacteria bacterium]|nr:hypothetical protein [Betaproteobacteria bacterium]